MAKSKAAKKAPWCPVDNCIKPLADALAEIARTWTIVGKEPPQPITVDMLYRDHNVDFLITWLQINISADFAGDLEETLFSPLRRFKKLDFKACQILSEEAGELVIWQRNAITTVIRQRYDWARNQHSDLEAFDPDKDEVLREIERPYTEIEHAFRDAARHLRQIAAVLLAKIRAREAERTNSAAGNGANSANISGLSSALASSNPRVKELANRLITNAQKLDTEQQSKLEIAREFTGETAGKDGKAKSLLSSIRRLKRS